MASDVTTGSALAIAALHVDPFSVSLADRPHSVFVDPATRNVFVDQGPGDDRLNGAVCFADRGPRFVAEPDGEGARLFLRYASWNVDLGFTAAADEARTWADDANRFLTGGASRNGHSAGTRPG